MEKIYSALLELYGPQGWWPVMDYSGPLPDKTGSLKGYHPGDYSIPDNMGQVFEICIGAILTQNTAWTNVEKALINLKKNGLLSPGGILRSDTDALKEAIRPAGYYNTKARKLTIFAEYFQNLNGRTPSREELLSVWGIGKETADSILLYAFKVPAFVVDAYTRRIFSNLGVIEANQEYDSIRAIFENSLPKDYKIYQEYHALIVEHAKRYYRNKDFSLCPLRTKFYRK